MNTISGLFQTLGLALFLALLLGPRWISIAKRFGLIDKPNSRKVHTVAIPLSGGLTIAMSALLAFLATMQIQTTTSEIYILFFGSITMLFIGLVDDRFIISSMFKFVFEIGLASVIFELGIRIDSFYGIFGIYELPDTLQYILTILVIVGCINAFNLTDGIDGLAGSLGLVGFIAYSIVAIALNNWTLATLFASIAGAIMGFLRFNLSKSSKMFMGDSGSLTLGYVLIVGGIMLIQESQQTFHFKQALMTVIGVFLIPVFDSIRVYWKRIKSGFHPFRPDKTHLHHLLLDLGIKHTFAAFVITISVLSTIVIAILSGAYLSLTVALIGLVFILHFLRNLLHLNSEINIWRKKIKEMEL